MAVALGLQRPGRWNPRGDGRGGGRVAHRHSSPPPTRLAAMRARRSMRARRPARQAWPARQGVAREAGAARDAGAGTGKDGAVATPGVPKRSLCQPVERGRLHVGAEQRAPRLSKQDSDVACSLAGVIFWVEIQMPPET